MRNPKLLNVPMIAETVPRHESSIWWKIFAPPKIPAEVIARFHAATTEVSSTLEFQKKLEEPGGAVVKMSSAGFGRLMVSEQDKRLEVIKTARIRGE